MKRNIIIAKVQEKMSEIDEKMSGIVDKPTDKLSDIFDEKGKVKQEVISSIKKGLAKIEGYLNKEAPGFTILRWV